MLNKNKNIGDGYYLKIKKLKDILGSETYKNQYHVTYKPKTKNRSKPLYSFKHNNKLHTIYDDRECGHNNFTLKIIINKKIMLIIGIEEILKYLKQKGIHQDNYFYVEKIFMQETI